MTSRSGRIGRGVGGGLGRGFWTLFSASLLANLSDGIFQIALPLLAISLASFRVISWPCSSPRP